MYSPPGAPVGSPPVSGRVFLAVAAATGGEPEHERRCHGGRTHRRTDLHWSSLRKGAHETLSAANHVLCHKRGQAPASSSLSDRVHPSTVTVTESLPGARARRARFSRRPGAATPGPDGPPRRPVRAARSTSGTSSLTNGTRVSRRSGVRICQQVLGAPVRPARSPRPARGRRGRGRPARPAGGRRTRRGRRGARRRRRVAWSTMPRAASAAVRSAELLEASPAASPGASGCARTVSDSCGLAEPRGGSARSVVPGANRRSGSSVRTSTVTSPRSPCGLPTRPTTTSICSLTTQPRTCP